MKRGEKLPVGAMVDLSAERGWLAKYHKIFDTARFVVMGYEGVSTYDPLVVLARADKPGERALRFAIQSEVWETGKLVNQEDAPPAVDQATASVTPSSQVPDGQTPVS